MSREGPESVLLPDESIDIAACAGNADFFEDGDFHDEETSLEKFERELRAIGVCAVCTVRSDCLGTAIKQRIDTGVWGGFADESLVTVIRRGSSVDAEEFPTFIARATSDKALQTVHSQAKKRLYNERNRLERERKKQESAA